MSCLNLYLEISIYNYSCFFLILDMQLIMYILMVVQTVQNNYSIPNSLQEGITQVLRLINNIIIIIENKDPSSDTLDKSSFDEKIENASYQQP